MTMAKPMTTTMMRPMLKTKPDRLPRRLSLLIFCLLIGGHVVLAQDAGWTAWLYNEADGRMTQVNAGGQVMSEFVVTLPPGFDRYPRRVALGRGGSPFAYIAYNSATFQGQIVVANRDKITAAFSLPLTIADSFEFIADENNFNADNSALALGYSLQGGGWAVIVMDARTGAVTQTLRHDTALVAALGLPATPGLTPVVRRFQGRDVTFTLVQSGTEGASEYNSYTWNLDTNLLAQNFAFTALDSDTFPLTGEVVMSLPDKRLANQSASFTFFQANSLQVYNPSDGARYPFYNMPDATLFRPRFVQNGELILFSATTAGSSGERWIIIRRDGSFVGSLPTISLSDVRGLPDGFIYTTGNFTPNATTLVYVNTRGALNAGTPLWTSPANASPIIVWAGTDTLTAQVAFSPWAKLADAAYEFGTSQAQAQAQPTLVSAATLVAPGALSPGEVPQPTAVIGGILAVGRRARIATTQGDKLNLRLAPSVNGDVVARLGSGALVTILEGPRRAEGYVWWKIRAPNGTEGWVVESVQDKDTRLQTLVPE
jgi:SH3-like domain-containing protein